MKAPRQSRTNQRKKLLRVTISVDSDDYATMEKLGRQNTLSISWLIRRAMREYIEGVGKNSGKVRGVEGIAKNAATKKKA